MNLSLQLKKEWFDKILSGEKKIEYRDKTDYYFSRLFEASGVPKKFDTVIFRNGYYEKCPIMSVQFVKIKTTDEFYEIHLGEINWSANCTKRKK